MRTEFQFFSVLALISLTASLLLCMYADNLHTGAKQKKETKNLEYRFCTPTANIALEIGLLINTLAWFTMITSLLLTCGVLTGR